MIQNGNPKREYPRVKLDWKLNLIAHGKWKCQKCGMPPEDAPHHSRGRSGRLLIMSKFFIPLCYRCHCWVHDNVAAAREYGLICQLGEWNRLPDRN